MSTTALEIIDAARSEWLSDTDGDVYTNAQGLVWVNDAQDAVTLVRPDAKAVVANLSLAASTKQDVPSTYRRLIGIVCNMGADGLTRGKAITGPVKRENLDGHDPDWPTTSGAYVRQYIYNDAVPEVFYVLPYVTTAWYIEAEWAGIPTPCATKDTNIDLKDIYVPAMKEWVAYCFAARDDEITPNWERAGRHFKNFFNLLGVKLQADMAFSPKVTERK